MLVFFKTRNSLEMLSKHKWPLLFIVALCLYGLAASASNRFDSNYRISTIKFIFPSAVSQLLAFGDPYLATNINFSRVVTLFFYNTENAAPRAKLLEQSSSLNPKHLDSIYQAAVLPWEGHAEESIAALNRSTAARYWDWIPPFMQGLTLSNFEQNHVEAAALIALASERVDESDADKKAYLQVLSTNIFSKGNDLEASLRYMRALISSVKSEKRREFLENRANQIAVLIELRAAALEFENRYGRKLSTLDELISSGVLSEKPTIYGAGYVLDENGLPTVYK